MAWSVMEGCAVEGGVGTVFGVLRELKAYLPFYACGFPKGGSLSGKGNPSDPCCPAGMLHTCAGTWSWPAVTGGVVHLPWREDSCVSSDTSKGLPSVSSIHCTGAPDLFQRRSIQCSPLTNIFIDAYTCLSQSTGL